MYNRKFNIRKDFHILVELEHEIMPIINKIDDEVEKTVLAQWARKTFNNQFKQ